MKLDQVHVFEVLHRNLIQIMPFTSATAFASRREMDSTEVSTQFGPRSIISQSVEITCCHHISEPNNRYRYTFFVVH